MSTLGRNRSDLVVQTAEAVTEGHPDKVADYIADSILDAHLAQDPLARVACEVLVKGGHAILAGEISSRARVDHEATVRGAIRAIGYLDGGASFTADGVRVVDITTLQAAEISRGVDGEHDPGRHQGAGDQGLMFGYATRETDDLMPLPAVLAHRLAAGLARARCTGEAPWLRPDGKTQVSVAYDGATPRAVAAVVVSTQHAAGTPRSVVEGFVRESLLPAVLGDWHHGAIALHVNPAGSFVEGGPDADCGLTGRKIMVDTYGGLARHGGGAFSGKDATKVDRSAAYFARFVARRAVLQGLAARCEIQVAYAIGRSEPVGLSVETFGTGDVGEVLAFAHGFDWTPGGIIERLDLQRPIYRQTTNYGHFGRRGFTWEA